MTLVSPKILLSLAVTLGLAASAAGCGGGGTQQGGTSHTSAVEIVATGRRVSGFGTVGEGGFSLRGLDGAGRAIAAGWLSDGRRGLFRADGRDIRALWLSDDGSYGVDIHPTNVDVSHGGRVAAVGSDLQSIAIFDGSGWQTAIVAGVSDRDGMRLCLFTGVRLNDADVLAFEAEVALDGERCESMSRRAALYAFDGVSLDRLALSVPDDGDDGYFSVIELMGVTAGGEVVFGESPTGIFEVVAVHGESRRTLFRDGEVGPSGEPLRGFRYSATSSAGNLIFNAQEDQTRGLYRVSTDGTLERLAAGGESLAGVELRAVENFNNTYPALNRHGEAVFAGRWHTETDSGLRLDDGIFLLGAGQAKMVFAGGPNSALGERHATPASGLFINDAGQIAFSVYAFGGPHGNVAVRWDDGELTKLIGSGDDAGRGAVFADGGLSSTRCLAADGSVAVTARATNNDVALLCGDAAGLVTVAASGDDAQAGDLLLLDQGPCEFTDEGLLFAATGARPAAGGEPKAENGIYRRSSPSGLERVLGPGDLTADGDSLRSVSFGFAANRAGDVVASARGTRDGNGLYRRRRADPPARIGPPFAPHAGELDYQIPSLFGIAGGGEVVIVAARRDDTRALLVWDDGPTREIYRSPAPGPGAVRLLVRGRQVALALYAPSEVVQLDIDGGGLRTVARSGEPFAGRIVTGVWPVDLTATGRLLLGVHFADAAELEFFTVREGAEPEPLTASEPGLEPIAFNDEGFVVWMTRSGFSRRARLLLSGGVQGASCGSSASSMTMVSSP